jgi:hypothetical protein
MSSDQWDFPEDSAVKVEYKTIKFGKVGDWVKGTLTGNTKQLVNNLSPKKEMQTVFEIKVQGGSLHLINKKQVDAEATILQPGEFWSYITSKPVMLDMLKGIKVGQIVGLRLTEIKEAKQAGYDDTKIIKVYPGAMDDTYQGESAADSQ